MAALIGGGYGAGPEGGRGGKGTAVAGVSAVCLRLADGSPGGPSLGLLACVVSLLRRSRFGRTGLVVPRFGLSMCTERPSRQSAARSCCDGSYKGGQAVPLTRSDSSNHRVALMR
jgi:hypothetical protein